MAVRRGDVVLTYVKFSSGPGGKVRPALVVQSDNNNQRLQDTIVALITRSTHRAQIEATQLLIDMLYDLTPLISERLKVWPGDTLPSRQVLCDMKLGASLTLSTLHATVHLGAHADAPSHYGVDAAAIHERNLDYYLGRCQVVRVSVPRGSRIKPGGLQTPVAAPRLLLSTNTYPDPEHFNDDFAALSPELVEDLHGQGVKLVGIDTPSVDPFSSKDLPAHRMFLKLDMAILEGLVLKGVPPGVYELIALPLRLAAFDASPVRAILRTYPLTDI